MPLTSFGLSWLASRFMSASDYEADSTNGVLVVGDGTTPQVVTNNYMLGTQKTVKGMDSGYPQRILGNVMIFQSTFGPSEGNFTWNEWGVSSNPGVYIDLLLTREVVNQGTKLAGQTWVLQATITINLGT